MFDLRSAWRGGSVVRGRDVRAVGYKFLLEGLSLTFVQLEYGTVKTTVAIKIFNCEEVVFLMCEETHHPPSTIWSCSFAHHQSRAADLLVSILAKDVLNGAYAHVCCCTSIVLKLHDATLDFQFSGGVMPLTFKPQDMRDMDGRPWDRTLCFTRSLAYRSRA